MHSNHFRSDSVRFTPLLGAVLALAFALAGCGGKTTSPVKPVPLTLEASGVGGASQRFTTSALAAPSATDTIPVTFTQALLSVRDVRFVLGDDADDTDTLGIGDAEPEDDGGQVRFRGPYVIDLLAGIAQSLGTEMVPPGPYQRAQGHLRALSGDDGPASVHSSLIGSTVRLEGTIGGEGGGPFVYSARIDNEFMIRGDFTVLVETPATAFIVFDLTQFLTSREGHFLDPRVVENDFLIKQAIRHAIKVGMDDDHDGEMDDALSEVEE